MDLKSMSMEELEAIVQKHCASETDLGNDVVYPVMEEIARRLGKRTGEEAKAAWEMFLRYYLPVSVQDLTDPETGLTLEPSWHGEHCPGNGENGNPCCCDECDHYKACFPDWHPGAIWDEHTQRFV